MFPRCGRVGRSFFRIARTRDIEVVAVKDLTDKATLAHLLTPDSTLGRLDATVVAEPGAIVVDGQRIVVMPEKDPAALEWAALGADVVIESTLNGRLDGLAVRVPHRASSTRARRWHPVGW